MYQRDSLVNIYLWLNEKRISLNWLDFILNKLEIIFHTPGVRKFARNIGTIFFYNRAASFFITILGIITARVLGPADYGNIALIGNASNFLIIPMIMGINSSMFKLLPGSLPKRTRELIGTAFFSNLVTTIFFGWLFLNGYEWIGKPLKFTHSIWDFCIVTTILINFFSLNESFLRGREEYSFIGKGRLVSSIVFFISVLFFYRIGLLNLSTYYIGFFLSQALFCVISIWKNRKWLISFSWPTAKEIYRYGGIIMLHMFFNAIVFSSDIFIVNYFNPGRDVGIYSVYQGAVKNLFVMMFYEVFSVVFLPTIAQMDRFDIYRKINKMTLQIIVFVTFSTFGLTILTVCLFGREYPLNFGYALLVALSISFYLLFQLYNSIISMEGNREALLCLIPFLIVLPFALFLQVGLTKTNGLTGAMMAVLLTNISLFITSKFLIEIYLKKQVKCD